MTERATTQTATPFTQAEWREIEFLAKAAIGENRGPQVLPEKIKIIFGGYIAKAPLAEKTILIWLANTENVYRRIFQKEFVGQWIPKEEVNEGLPVAYIEYPDVSGKTEYALIALSTPEQKRWLTLRPNFDYSRFQPEKTI